MPKRGPKCKLGYLCILYGDGTNMVTKKGGDGIGYSGPKHQKGEVIVLIDNQGYVRSPLPRTPVNKADRCCSLRVSPR